MRRRVLGHARTRVMTIKTVGPWRVLAAVLGLVLCMSAPPSGQTAGVAAPQYPGLPSKIPTRFEAVRGHLRLHAAGVMIPMRDGVRLHTVILVPKEAEVRRYF